YAAAVREDDEQLAILLQIGGTAALTLDGGVTWKSFALSAPNLMQPWASLPETGGPYAHARGGSLRVGTRAMPFVFATAAGLFGITSGGEGKSLLPMPLSLIGSSRDGARVLAKIGTT